MKIGISPTVDFAFKLMLGSPEHVGVTIHFLNAVLGGAPQITDVTIINPFLGKETDDDKLAVLDVLATDNLGRKLNIEMQTAIPAGLSQRLAYYASRLYCEQLHEGENYTSLRPAISICVLTKSLFPQCSEMHLDFRLRDNHGLALTDNLQIHLLEFSKLRVTEQDVYHASPLERWAYFFQNADLLTRNDVTRLFPDHEFSEAAGVLEMISQTPEERLRYEARLKFKRDEAARMEGAMSDARTEGMSKGLSEGLSQGLSQGRQEGLARQTQTLQDLAGMPLATLAELANLDPVELEQMVEELQRQLRERLK